jgi:hypothetical protein
MKFMQIAICMKFMQIVFFSMFLTISYVESLQIAICMNFMQIAICKSTTIFKRYMLHKNLVMVASEFQF